MPKKAKSDRAGAVEGIRWFFSEERPAGPPPKPFFLTYLGPGVVEIPGVGAFQDGTTAEVDRAVADAHRGLACWRVIERPRAGGAGADAAGD